MLTTRDKEAFFCRRNGAFWQVFHSGRPEKTAFFSGKKKILAGILSRATKKEKLSTICAKRARCADRCAKGYASGRGEAVRQGAARPIGQSEKKRQGAAGGKREGRGTRGSAFVKRREKKRAKEERREKTPQSGAAAPLCGDERRSKKGAQTTSHKNAGARSCVRPRKFETERGQFFALESILRMS